MGPVSNVERFLFAAYVLTKGRIYIQEANSRWEWGMVEHKQQQIPAKSPLQQQPVSDVPQRQQTESLRLQRSRSARNVETEPLGDTARKTPGRVTGVFADLMIFVEVSDSSGTLDLVFKPNKIVNYHGERLEDLGVQAGTLVPEIQWDISTRQVSSVVLSDYAGRQAISTSA
jgi:hypothetical protein